MRCGKVIIKHHYFNGLCQNGNHCQVICLWRIFSCASPEAMTRLFKMPLNSGMVSSVFVNHARVYV